MAQTSQAKDSNQSDNKKNTQAKQPVPSAQVSGPTGETLGPIALEGALADPLSASTAQIGQLQRQYGNRATRRLLQRARADVQRQAPIGLEGGTVEGGLQSQIDSARGTGRALDKGVGAQLGNAMGADFSGVKVHADTQADSLNRSLSAKAFTTGSDIFFSQGAYNPGTSGGKELLAHELTHVVQQGGATQSSGAIPSNGAIQSNGATQRKANKVQTKLKVGPAGDKYEQEADQVAQQVMTAPSSSGGTSFKDEERVQPKRVIQRHGKHEDDEVHRKALKSSQAGGASLLSQLTPFVPNASGPLGKVQAKLTVGAAGDKYEQEADQVAKQVLRTPTQSTALEQTQVKTAQGAYDAQRVQRKKDRQNSLATIVDAGIDVADARGNLGQLGHAMDIWIDVDFGDRPLPPTELKTNTIHGLELEYWEFVDVPHDNVGPPGVKPWNDIYAMKPDASTFDTAAPGCDMTWKAAVDAAAAGTLTGVKRIGFRDIPGLFERNNRNTERTLKFRIVINDGIAPKEIFATQLLRMNNGHLGYSAYEDSLGNKTESHGFGGVGYAKDSVTEQGALGTEPGRLTGAGVPNKAGVVGTLPAAAQALLPSFVEQLVETPNAVTDFDDTEGTSFLNNVPGGQLARAQQDWPAFAKEFMTDKPGVAAGQFMLPAPAGAVRKEVTVPGGGLLVAILIGGAIQQIYYTDGTTKTVSMNMIQALSARNWTIDLRSFVQVPTDMVQAFVTATRSKHAGKFKKARQNSIWNAHLRSFTRQGNNYVVNVGSQIGGKIKKNKEILVDDPEIRDISGQWIKAKFGPDRGFIRADKVTYATGPGIDVVDDGAAFEDMATTIGDNQIALATAVINYLNVHQARTPAVKNAYNTAVTALHLNIPANFDALIKSFFEAQFRLKGNSYTAYNQLEAAYPTLTGQLNPAYQAVFGEDQLNLMLLDKQTATEVGHVGALQGLANANTGNHPAMIVAVMNYVRANPTQADTLESVYNQHVATMGLDVPNTLGEIANAHFVKYFRDNGNGFAHYNQLLQDFPGLDYRLPPAYRLVFGETQYQTMLKDKQDAEFAIDVPDPNSLANQNAKQLFLAHGLFTQTDFEPRVGNRGNKVDLEFDPATRVLKIIVKVSFEYQDSGFNAGPGADPTSKFSRNVWTQPDKDDYKQKFIANTVGPFNGSGITIGCVRPGWEDIVVTPQFEVREVPMGSGEHFSNKANKAVITGNGPTEKLQGTQAGAGPGSLILSEFDVHDKLRDPLVHQYLHRTETTGNIEPAYELDRKRLIDILGQFGHINVAGYSTMLGPQKAIVQRSISNVVDNLKRLAIPSDLAHLHPLIVEAGAATLVDATRQADTIKRLFVAAGVRNPIQTQGVVGNPEIKITAAPEDPAVKQTYINSWSRLTAAHEFGHKIGLIDEYYSMSSSQTVKMMISAGLLPPSTRGDHLKLKPPTGMVAQQAQKQIDQMNAIKEAGLEAPDLANNAPGGSPKSTSVMSGGYKVEKIHFLSAREGLAALTTGMVDKKFWKIQ